MVFSEQAKLPQAEMGLEANEVDVGAEFALYVQEDEKLLPDCLQGHEELPGLCDETHLRSLAVRVTLMTLWLLMSQLALSLLMVLTSERCCSCSNRVVLIQMRKLRIGTGCRTMTMTVRLMMLGWLPMCRWWRKCRFSQQWSTLVRLEISWCLSVRVMMDSQCLMNQHWPRPPLVARSVYLF